MKFHKDGSFTLEGPEEIAAFDELVNLGKTIRQTHQARAQQVFDQFIGGETEVVDLDDPTDRGSDAANEWAQRMDIAIEGGLDHRSIGHFVDLVLKWHKKSSQAAKAHKRHAENHAMKAEVFAWLDSNMQRFKSMDSAAEAIAGKVVPVSFRTARSWVGHWKKDRSSGTL